jgi:hypothetical protein
MEPLPLHATAPNAGIVTSVPQSPSSHAESLRKSTDPNCYGQLPSTASVTPLLSRLVRSSNTARGVQCQIPPLPNQSTTQKLHP